MQMAAGGSRVKRCPLFGIFGVDIGPEFEQQFHHALAIVDTALKINWHNISRFQISNFWNDLNKWMIDYVLTEIWEKFQIINSITGVK